MRRRLLFTIFIIFMLIKLSSPALAAGEDTIKGSIEAIDYSQNIITILDYDGNKKDIEILPSTLIEIEGKNFTIDDLYFGQEVDIIIEDGKAEKIIAYLEDDPDRYGYIMPGNRFKSGNVLFITNSTIEIKNGDKREKYRITSNTTIYKDGEIVDAIRIKEGDRVLLYFDDIYSSEVRTLRVEDSEEHVEGILRGKLQIVDERKEEIYISYPYVYDESSRWIPFGLHLVKLKANDYNLYNGSEKIELSDLVKLKGKTVYVAYNTSYGRLNVSKLQVKNGTTRIYDSEIQDIEYGIGKMIVDNNLIHFNEGTIVVKDNRLVDVLNMDLYEKVNVNADLKNGTIYANVVSLEGSSVLEERLDNTKISIYKGRIQDIFDYEVEIGKLSYKQNYLKLTEENLWEEKEEEQRILFTEDTLIYDSQLMESIPVDAFNDSRYIEFYDIKNTTLRNRLESNFYKGKTAYFIVKESEFGKELLALNITPNISSYRYDVRFDYSMVGDISSIDFENGTMNLTNVKNFNTLNKTWERAIDETLDISKGVVMYNDVPIPMDKLYTLKKGLKAYVIKYKESNEDIGYVVLIED